MRLLTAIWDRIKKVWYHFFPKKCRTIKPSGTVSLISNQSQGIEPVFKPYYVRYDVSDRMLVEPADTLSEEDKKKIQKIISQVELDMFGNVHFKTNIVVHGDVLFDA